MTVFTIPSEYCVWVESPAKDLELIVLGREEHLLFFFFLTKFIKFLFINNIKFTLI